MKTRFHTSHFKPKQFTNETVRYPFPHALTISSFDHVKPNVLRRYLVWCTTMTEEFNASLKNGIWSLTSSHPFQNLVRCRWVFWIQRNVDSSIQHYKACLVAKGFHQQHGFNYEKTFSPVLKPTIIHLDLSLVVVHERSICSQT